MGLVALAENDLGTILEDTETGTGVTLMVTDPVGNAAPVVGRSTDIAQVIDPDTGEAVSGRLASVAFRISTLAAAGFGLPVGVSDTSAKPWQVGMDDVNGNSYTFKVIQSNPDRAAGLVTCILGIYNG